jgi:hypothetical protein
MEGSCSTGQSSQWAVVPVEEEEEEEEEVLVKDAKMASKTLFCFVQKQHDTECPIYMLSVLFVTRISFFIIGYMAVCFVCFCLILLSYVFLSLCLCILIPVLCILFHSVVLYTVCV